MKYFINLKYEQEGLDQPNYMFLEFFMASISYQHAHSIEWINRGGDISSITERVARPISLTNAREILNYVPINGRILITFTEYSAPMMDMARFYDIPVLSVINMLYPSLVRYSLTHSLNEGWPYTRDGIHTNLEGCKLVVEHMLKPFFLDQMSARESDKLYDGGEKKFPFNPYYPLDLRMFKADMYKEVHIIGNFY